VNFAEKFAKNNTVTRNVKERISPIIQIGQMISQERIDLERLAEIEIDLRTFGNLTFEQEKEKREILTKYEK
jgi:hypothetical protein